MQYDTSEELYVVVYHVPGDFVSSGHPVVLVDGLVAFDVQEVVAFGGKVAVKLCGGYFDAFVFCEEFRCCFYQREYLGQSLVEGFLVFVENGFFEFVDLFPHDFAFVVFDVFDILFISAMRAFSGATLSCMCA